MPIEISSASFAQIPVLVIRCFQSCMNKLVNNLSFIIRQSFLPILKFLWC